ncbi:MAG TPA: C39 family peptidase [Candidatus Methanoperedens sp.]|nr:C39 family peptidase [Candidatus Methanoperedens sp.]
MVKRIILILSFLYLFLPINSYAADNYENMSIEELDKLKNELIKNSSSLSSQIQLISIQIAQTQNKIKQTTFSIKTLRSEIANLGVKIGNLDVSLNNLSAIYISQISQNYKLQKKIPLYSFLISLNFNDYFEKYKYISRFQKENQDTLLNLETTRTTLDQEKQAKAKKQKELESLEKVLAAQQKDLTNQNNIKNELLKTTQKQLGDVLAQLSALRRFSSAFGSTCLSSTPGGGSDGNFYSQRDPRWCKQTIGYSSDTIGAVGCYISSISMVFKKLGSDISPSAYAAIPSNFQYNSAYASIPHPPSGYTYKQVSYNTDTIDKELDAGRYVIVQISMKTISGMHFVVIIGGSKGNYTIHDPWFGSDISFSSRYSTSSIMSLRLITK